MASRSRAGLVGLAVGGVVLLLLGRWAVVKKLAICASAAAAAAGIAFLLSRGAYGGFITKAVTVDSADQASIAPRLATWDDAWSVFVAHPVNGVGTGAYGGGVHELGIALDVPAAEIKTSNLWLEVLAELGALGIAALSAMLMIVVIALWRRRREEPFAPFVITAIVASTAMFAFVQTLWVPYRWIVWILGFSLAFPLAVARPRLVEGTDHDEASSDSATVQADRVAGPGV